jgi:hypothetical protein
MNQIPTKLVEFITLGIKERIFLYKFTQNVLSLDDDNKLEKLSRQFYLLWIFFTLLMFSLILFTFHFDIPILFFLISFENFILNTRKLIIIYQKIIL